MSETESENASLPKRFKWDDNDDDEKNSEEHQAYKEPEAGNYYIGPIVKKYVRAPVTQCLARKKGTEDYYLMKILLLDDLDTSDKCCFMRRTVFHNEVTCLNLLKGHPGVIQLYDFFKDHIFEERSGKKIKRICMVLECLIPYRHHNCENILLNHYLKEDKLNEMEALYIFYHLLLVIEDLHSKNIVHRDLKLSNIILNRKTLKVKLIDFYYAKLLSSNNEVLFTKCRPSGGSVPLHPVLPKSCDMWSAGVILYTMLNGCLPFANAANYGSSLATTCSLRDVYLKIMEKDCTLSNNSCISDGTKELLRNILWKIPQFRLKASEAVDMVSTLLALQCTSQNPSLLSESNSTDQVVPECPTFDSSEQDESGPSTKKASSLTPEFESEETSAKSKVSKMDKIEENPQLQALSLLSSKSSQQNSLLNRKEIKYAMLRLGATSINSINALSFNYSKKNSCLS